jgi:hypothetical protein
MVDTVSIAADGGQVTRRTWEGARRTVAVSASLRRRNRAARVCYPRWMAAIRPSRFLRPDPARVALELLVCHDDIDAAAASRAKARDPRHLGRLLFEASSAVELAVVDMVRAGVLRRDALPSLTVVRQRGPTERTLIYAAVRGDTSFDVEATSHSNTSYAAGPSLLRFVDKKGKVARAVEVETEREPDAVLAISDTLPSADVMATGLSSRGSAVNTEVWVVDDESATARISTLLEGAELSLLERSRASWAQTLAGGPAAWGLACFVGADDDGGPVPVGLNVLPLRGPLVLR